MVKCCVRMLPLRVKGENNFKPLPQNRIKASLRGSFHKFPTSTPGKVLLDKWS